MKKFLGIILIAGALVACNNSSESTTGNDSPATTGDSLSTIPPATTGDSTTNLADTSHRAGDSLTKSGDTTKTKTKKSK